jgi:hypothetical protein
VPVFKNRIAFEIARGVTAFLNLEAGITRGGTPSSVARPATPRTPRKAKLNGPRFQTTTNAQDLRGAGPPVFFVVGLGKSGTTWLMKTLDAHPEVLCKGEGRFFGADWKKEILKEETKNRQPSSLYNALLGSEYLRLWIERSPWSRHGDADEHLKNLTRLATDYFLTKQLARTNKKFVGDKSPLISLHIMEEISEIYPEAKVIHIIRDGRDRAISSTHRAWRRARRGQLHGIAPEQLVKAETHGKNPTEIVEAGEEVFSEDEIRGHAQYWNERVGRAVEDGPALLGSNYTEVRYEDLLERTPEETRRLLGFLGADTSRDVVEHCVNAASFEALSKGRQPGEEDVSSFYRKGVAGDWKNYFSERDKQIYKEIAGELLVRLGYEKDFDW